MDETTKVIIGTISGFIVAFLAEPVKIYFQRRARKNGLRRALHLELYFNYVSLRRFVDKFQEKITKEDLHKFVWGFKYATHVESYQYYISHDADLFYQLKEAMTINWLYAGLIRLLETVRARFDSKEDPNIAFDEIKSYLREYKKTLDTNDFDKHFLAKVIGREQVEFVQQKDF